MQRISLAALLFLFTVTSVTGNSACGAERVDSSHWSYEVLNRFIDLGLVNGYHSGFRVSNADRITMARYISLIFDGKSVEEILEKNVLQEADLSTLAELVSEYIVELSSYYPSRLTSLLDKSLKLKEKLAGRSFADRTVTRVAPGENGQKKTPGPSTVEEAIVSGAASKKSKKEGDLPAEKTAPGKSWLDSDEIKTEIKTGENGEGTKKVAVGSEEEDSGLSWSRSVERTLTVRNVDTENGYGYELLNAEKKAGLHHDVFYEVQNQAADEEGAIVRSERGVFEVRNSDLYDYLLHFTDSEDGTMHSLGKRLRPDFTEYTVRAKEITGYYGEIEMGNHTYSLVTGAFQPDHTGAGKTNTFIVTDRVKASSRSTCRTSFLMNEGTTNKLGSFELLYRANDLWLFENEFIKSRYNGINDSAFESRARFKKDKVSLNLKYKEIGDNFANLLSSSLNPKVRLSDLSRMEGNLDYRFSQYITSMTNMAGYTENNSGAVKPIPVKTADLSEMLIFAIPGKPKLLAYYKLLDKNDDSGSGLKDDTLKLTLLRLDHQVKKTTPRAGFNHINFEDRVNNIDYTTKVKTFGFDQLLRENSTLRGDYTRTVTDGTINTDLKQSKIELDHKFDEKKGLIASWTKERATGDDRRDKKIYSLNYSYMLNEVTTLGLIAERIDYTDDITRLNTFDSNEYAVRLTQKF